MTTENLNNVTSSNSVDDVTCENIRTDKGITFQSTKIIADNEIRSQEAPRDKIKEHCYCLIKEGCYIIV